MDVFQDAETEKDMIKKILIIPHTHVDIGYTDPQKTALSVNEDFIDDALNTIERTKNYPGEAAFKWTLEVFLPLIGWWKRAEECKRERLIEAVKLGLFEITAMPHSTTCFCDNEEIEYMMGLLPEEIKSAVKPSLFMQNDTNGIPRGALSLAAEHGVDKLWMGPNSYYGMPPMPSPTAFYWNLDNGKKVLVWCNSAYNDGTFLFNENWRIGPVPGAYDFKYRKPHAGDIFKTDEEGLAEAKKLLDKKIAEMTGGDSGIGGTDGFTKCLTRKDYPYETLITSVSNQWRCDNDPPMDMLPEFVKAWNEKGYEPVLEIATAGNAMDYLKETEDIPELSGEWSDWWARGLAANPTDMRFALEGKRNMAAGQRIRTVIKASYDEELEEIRKEYLHNFMMYSEHTFSSWDSCAEPYSLATISIEANKRVYACNMLETSKHYMHKLLADKLITDQGRIVVFNPTGIKKTVRLNIPANCLRGEFHSLKDADTGELILLEKAPGNMYFIKPEREEYFGPLNEARFSGDTVPDQNVISDVFVIEPFEKKEFILCNELAEAKANAVKAEIRTDAKGWPCFVSVADKTLIDGKAGVFEAANAGGISPRWTFRDVFDVDDADEREKAFNENIELIGSEYGDVVREEKYGRIKFIQNFTHPSLSNARRILEIDTSSCEAKLTVEIVRKYDFNPEIYYILMDSPVKNGKTVSSVMGRHFIPGEESLKGSCQDYFVTDGWTLFENENGSWIFSARDSVLTGLGEPHPSLRKNISECSSSVFAQVFDSTWDTNFSANACGLMTFTFDIAANVNICEAKEYALSAAVPEIVYIYV